MNELKELWKSAYLNAIRSGKDSIKARFTANLAVTDYNYFKSTFKNNIRHEDIFDLMESYAKRCCCVSPTVCFESDGSGVVFDNVFKGGKTKMFEFNNFEDLINKLSE